MVKSDLGNRPGQIRLRIRTWLKFDIRIRPYTNSLCELVVAAGAEDDHEHKDQDPNVAVIKYIAQAVHKHPPIQCKHDSRSHALAALILFYAEGYKEVHEYQLTN